MAKYATTEDLLSCNCGTEFTRREGYPIRLQVGPEEYQKGITCPRCQTSWWMDVEFTEGHFPESPNG